MLKINPFYLLFLFYFIVNFIFAAIGFSNNYVEIEFNTFNLKSLSFFYAFILQFFVGIILFLFYFFFSKLKTGEKLVIKDRGAIYLFILQSLFLIYNLFFGVNIAGVSAKSSNEILNLFFIFLPADLFYIIFSPYIKSDKYFRLNTFLFIISNVLRGWMGGILFAFFVSMCRKESIRVSLKLILNFSIIAILLLLLLPYLTQLKWAIRSDTGIYEAISETINMVNDAGYMKLLGESLDYIFNRFQHNYHVALLWENFTELNLEYNKGGILPYWGEGIVQTIISNILGIGKIPTLGTEMAHQLFYSKDSWSANPGLSGWLIVLQEKFIFFILYIFFILFIGFFTAVKYFGNKMVLILGVFSIFYLFHGWIGMYVSMVTYLLIISFIRRVKI